MQFAFCDVIADERSHYHQHHSNVDYGK